MSHKVGGECFNAIGITQNRVHLSRRFFAFLDLIVAGPLVGAALVVGLDLFQLLIVQQHLRRAAFVHDPHRDLVFDGLGHRVGVDDFAKHVQCGVDRRAGEANIGRVRQ